MSAAVRDRFTRSAGAARNAGFLIAAAMATCGAVVLDLFAGRILPDWTPGLLPWAALVAALEAAAAESLIHHLPLLDGRRLSYRFSEAVVIVISLKTVFLVQRGLEFAVGELSRYSAEFFSAFFNREFTIALLLSLIGWGFATSMAGHLIDLSLDEEILEEGARPSFTIDRGVVRTRMAGGIFTYGALLVGITAITRADLPLVWRGSPPAAGGGGSVLVFFALGLVLFSLNQFSVLRGRWGWERLNFDPGITRAWLVYSALAIGVVLAIALVLPTGYGLGFFTTLGTLFNLLVTLVYFLLTLLILPFLMLISSLTDEEVQVADDPLKDIVLTPEALPQVAETPADPAAWLELVRSTLFWMLFIGVAVYAIIQFARNNEALWKRLSALPLFNRLAMLWTALLRWLKDRTSAAADGIREGVRFIRERSMEGGFERLRSFVRLNRLTPRERVIFLYRALVRRAGEAQIRRGRGQTPEEFSRDLTGALPGSAGEIRAMTAGFERARYTVRPVEEADFDEMNAHWRSLRVVLRERRQQ